MLQNRNNALKRETIVHLHFAR